MPIASGNKIILQYIEEATQGTTPGSPQMTVLRCTGRNINLKKGSLESAEVDSSRQVVDVRHGFNQVVGDLGFELSTDNFNDPLRFLLGGASASAWTAYTAVTNASAVAVTNSTTITRTSGNWYTDGYRPGDWIRGTGWTNSGNNADVRIVTIAGTGTSTITIDSSTGTLVTEVAGAGKQFAGIGKYLKVGTTFKTATIERAFTDLSEFQIFRGCAFNSMRLSARPDQIIGGSFGILGMSAALNNAASLDVTPTFANANAPMASFEAGFYVGGGFVNSVTSFDLNVDNQRSLQGVLGSKFSPEVFDGTCKITGNLTLMLQNDAYMDAFQNETVFNNMCLKNVDSNGDFISFNVYRAKFMGHDMDPPQNGPVLQSMPWAATIQQFSDGSSTFKESFRVQRSTST